MTASTRTSSQEPTQLKKGMAITSLVLGILGLPTLGLLLIGGLVGLILGIVALLKSRSAPLVYGGKGIAIAGIVTNALALTIVPFMIGIIAAIAIPSLLRARVSANEAAAIGDTRSVISAEVAYSTSNGGFYDTLECLGGPVGCIPGYTGANFLDPTMVTTSPRRGYVSIFYQGAPAENPPAGVSPSSLQSFAYVSVPSTLNQTGVRAFCGDSTGRVCSTDGGSPPEPVGGLCPASCESLR